MCRDQTIVIKSLREAAAVAIQQLEEVPIIVVVAEKYFAGVASVHHMMVHATDNLMLAWHTRHGALLGVRVTQLTFPVYLD